MSDHDDREDHGGGADHRGADEHGLGRGLEGVAGAVVLLEEVLGRLEVDVEAVVLPDLLLDAGDRLDERQLVDRLGVVGDRAVGVDGDRHRAHAEEAEGHQAEGEDRGRHHERGEPQRAHAVGDAHERHDDQAQPVRAEVAGDEAGEDVQRRAALARGGDDLARRGADSVEVKTLTSSGMIAPASVPQVMMVESFHQSDAVAEVRDQERTRRRRSDHRDDRGEPHQRW